MSPLDDWSGGTVSTSYFVFTANPDLARNMTLNREDLAEEAFLPDGVFERILGKAVAWCVQTSPAVSLYSMALFRHGAILWFGSQRFRLLCLPAESVIRLDVEGKNPLAVHKRLQEQINTIIAECLHALRFFTCIPYDPTPTWCPDEERTKAQAFEDDTDGMLLPLKQLRMVATSNACALSVRGGRRLLSAEDIRGRYGQWLEIFNLRSSYDIFISYR